MSPLLLALIAGGGTTSPPSAATAQVADRTGLSVQPQATTTHRQGTYRTQHTARAQVQTLRLGFSAVSTQWGGQPPLSVTHTIAAAVDIDGTVTPVTFDGQARAQLPVGAFVLSDPVAVTLGPGEDFYVRRYQEVPTLGDDMIGNLTYKTAASRGEGSTFTTDGADLTTGGPWPTAALADVYAPVPHVILGEPSTTAPAVALVGDSIMAGAADDLWGENGGPGFGARACNATGRGYINFGFGGKRFADVTGAGTRAQWFPTGSLEACALVVCCMGRNDLNSSAAGTIKTNAVSLWAYLASRCPVVWQTTVTPYTTSTDGWSTLAGQAPMSSSQESARVDFNAWVRDGAPLVDGSPVGAGTTGALRAGQVGHPLSGYVEITDAVEPTRDDGRWNPGLTDDGIHPDGPGCAVMAVPLTDFLELQ